MTTPRNHPETTDLYQLCPEATSKGGTGLADTLGTTLGGFMTMISAMFPQTPAHAGGPLKIFAPILQAAVAGSDAQRGLESLLKAIGHALQDPEKRDRLKAVASALIETAGVIGGSLQKTSVRDDVQGDVESLAMALSHQAESLSRMTNPNRG